VVRTLAKLRIGPDLIFAAGAILMLVFVVRAVVLTVRKSEAPAPALEQVELAHRQASDAPVPGRA